MITLDLKSSCELIYLAEGAANIVYKIKLPPPSPEITSDLEMETCGDSPRTPLPSEIPPLRIEPRLEGKLLRLRKDLPSLVPVIDSHEYFESVIQPLFQPENLVEQILFKPSRDLIQDCNETLRRMEKDGSRARKRHGVYLIEEEAYGCLITDMTSDHDGSHVSLEFKPKWLVQSPSAPPESVRCRTCALRAMKFSKRENIGEVEHLKLEFCPLKLMSKDRAEVTATANTIFELSKPPDLSPQTSDLICQRLNAFLYQSSLLQHLQSLQTKFDPVGVLREPNLSNLNFLTAMTLRDCTLFLKISSSAIDHVEARLGDLDLKTPSAGKGEYWLGVERRLIEEGWYIEMGAEREEDGERHGKTRDMCGLW